MMPIGFCPICQERYVTDEHNKDFIHTCNSGIATLDNEDILNIQAANANWQGSENKLQFSRADIERDADLEDKTDRGNRASTHTTRQRLVFIQR